MSVSRKLLDGETKRRRRSRRRSSRSAIGYISHAANILMFLGARHKLAPKAEAGRLWANALQLTFTDFIKEIHDTHHPIASGLYYEDQKTEAKRRTDDFLKNRAPKFLGYFEDVLKRNGGKHLIGPLADLSRPVAVPDHHRSALRVSQGDEAARKGHSAVGRTYATRSPQRPRIAAYLASPRRIAFNEYGMFRHYPELDD